MNKILKKMLTLIFNQYECIALLEKRISMLEEDIDVLLKRKSV